MNSWMELFKSFLWVGCGSALGGIARFALSLFVASRVPGTFPLGTMLVNLNRTTFFIDKLSTRGDFKFAPCPDFQKRF